MKRKKLYHLTPVKIFMRVLSVTGFVILMSLYQCTTTPEDKEGKESVEVNDSISYYTQEIEQNPGDNLAFQNRARAFYQRGAYDAALKDLDKALKIDSTHLETYLLKSQIEMDYFRSQAALRTLQHAEDKWPETPAVKEDLAKTRLILKQYDLAREKALQALELNPSSAQPYLILGLVAKENQDTTSAITHLQKAVQNNADLLDGWVELAKLKMTKNPAEATPYFESALQIAPDDLHLWHTYAMYWQNMDSLDRAKISYRKIIHIDSAYKDAYYNQALILMDQDSFLKAIPLWDQFIRQDSDAAKGFYYRGISHEMAQSYQAALEDYQTARDLDPKLANIDKAIESIEHKLN